MFLGYRALNETVRAPFQVVNTSGGEAVASNLSAAIFEENATTALLTVTPSAIDTVNYKGLYRADIPLLTATGFEEGKQYYVRSKCDIDGVTTASVTGYFVIDSMRAKLDDITTGILDLIRAAILSDNPNDYADVTVGGYLRLVKHVICNRLLIDENTNTMTHYEDDGVTPAIVFDLKDETGVGTVTEPFERVVSGP